mmetsp:Transcript_13641/g.38382  ORF Transcript_13641/g.38382 Transcript_13641/m.38382 type:complete len:1474 (+) Transcript_13641:286-4707(+)
MMRSISLMLYAFAALSSAYALTEGKKSYNKLSWNIERSLQQVGGDFDRVNKILEAVEFKIEDDIKVSDEVFFTTLTLVVDSLTCRDIRIGNIALNNVVGNNAVDVDIALSDIDFTCDVEYQYEYGFLDGSGKVEFVTDGNSAATSMRFVTNDEEDDFSVTPSLTSCDVNVEIAAMNFIDADFAMSVVALFEEYLRDMIEEEIEAYACSQMSTTVVSSMDETIFTSIGNTLLDFAAAEDGEQSRQKEYNTTNALNFQEISDTQIGKMFKSALGELDKRFGTDNGNNDDLGINILLRSYVLDENGALILDFDKFLGRDALNFKLHDELTETNIGLKEVRIYGLDTMTKFDPLLVNGNHTLRNEFSWNTLTIEIDIALDMQPSSLENAVLQLAPDAVSRGISEDITIQFGAENVAVSTSLFALIDINSLSGFTFGSVLSLTDMADYSWVLPCLLSAVQDFHFIELVVSAQKINAPAVDGFVDDGLDRILSDFAEIAFEIYHDDFVEDVLPNMLQNTIKTFINNQISLILEDTQNDADVCPKYDNLDGTTTEEYVDFRQFFNASFSAESESQYGEFPALLRDLIDKELLEADPSTGMPKINEVLIDPLTKSQSGTEGTLLFGGDGEDIFNVVQRINIGGFDANVRLRASNIKIENLDTVVKPLILLDTVPTDPYLLNNSGTIGVEDRPVTLSTNFGFALIDEVEGIEIANELDISFNMHSASMMATTMLKITKSRLLGFPLTDIFDLNCWIATISAPTLNEQGVRTGDEEVTAAVVDFAASVANLNLNVSCVECSSPGVVELSDMLMSSGEAQNDVAFLANSLLSSVADIIEGGFMQVQIDRFLNDASKKCRHSPNYDPNFVAGEMQYKEFQKVEIESSTTYLMLVGVVSLALILLVAVIAFAVRCITRRRHRRWLSTLPEEKISALRHVQRREDSIELELNSTTSSMFQSGEDIPCVLRWGMPFIIMGNIALFLSGHLSLGATVNIEITIAGETISVDQFFEFSLAKSTIDIWNAGGKELAILMLIFSGIWPYTKQLITLSLWFTPTSWVSISRRGSILIWLDRLAKWSMIDIFVLIVCLAAFRVSVDSPTNFAFLPEGFYSFDLLVVPVWGLYANLIAQLISQISSHFIIHYHRKIAKKAHNSYLQRNTDISLRRTEDDTDEKVQLRTHKFGRPHRGEDEKLSVRAWTSSILVLLVLCSCACIIIGCILPSFSIEVFGLLGIAIEAGQEFREAITNHSAFTVIKLLFEQARFVETVKDLVGLGSFSVIFILTILLVPIIQSIALLGHWFIPMTTKQRRKLVALNEILQAWQYAEVYIIAVFVGSWQLGSLSSFMVNSYCGSLDGFFSELVFYGIVKDKDAQCFSIKSSIEGGFFILAVGSVLLTVINTFITKATKQYFRDEDELYKRIEIEKHCAIRLESDEMDQETTADDSHTMIHPVPVLFTDTFRWLLSQEERSKINSNGTSSVDDSSIIQD